MKSKLDLRFNVLPMARGESSLTVKFEAPRRLLDLIESKPSRPDERAPLFFEVLQMVGELESRWTPFTPTQLFQVEMSGLDLQRLESRAREIQTDKPIVIVAGYMIDFRIGIDELFPAQVGMKRRRRAALPSNVLAFPGGKELAR